MYARVLLVLGLSIAAQPASAQPVFIDGFESPGPPQAGAVIFTEIMSNPAQVADQVGEWFEIANVGGRGVQLQGCIVEENSGSSVVVGALLLPPGGIAVFARSLDPLTNGSVAADHAFGFSLTAEDLLALTCSDVLIDATDWSGDTSGRSRSLHGGAWDAFANDVSENWCLSSPSYNGTDTGTPGSAGHDCGSGLR